MAGAVAMVQSWAWSDVMVRAMIIRAVLFPAGVAFLALQFPSTGRPGDGPGPLSLGDKAVLLLPLGFVHWIAEFLANLVVVPRRADVSVGKFVVEMAGGSLVAEVLKTGLLSSVVLTVALARPDVHMTPTQHVLVYGTPLLCPPLAPPFPC